MPFGLVNGSASFIGLMRKLLNGMNSVENFIDDIIVYTKSFQEHIQIVRELLERLRSAKLTAKPSKCFIGYSSLECLGHIVGNEQLKPVPDKVTAIMQFQRPETKKQVKSFLGLVGYSVMIFVRYLSEIRYFESRKLIISTGFRYWVKLHFRHFRFRFLSG